MFEFMAYCGKRYERDFFDYAVLHQWSVDFPEEFWPAVADFTGMVFDKSWEDASGSVLVDRQQMPGAKWFTGSRLNFAANLLHFNDDHPAIIFRDESGGRRELSYAELRRQVAGTAKALRAAGVVAGDRVAGFLPNCPEAIVAMLSATSIGAIWSSCSPDFGVNGVLDRFKQIEPKVLFAADGYRYAGKRIDSLEVVAQLSAQIESLQQIVIIPFLGGEPDISEISAAALLPAFVDLDAVDGDDLQFESLPFDHPVYIMYSSGTTGAPKCIVHGAGGSLIQHLKEHVLHTDVNRTDRLFFFTTCGWMMWNWLVSGLASGATLVLYDGSPFSPDPGVLWRIAEEEGITIFGAGAKYLAAIEKSGFIPRDECELNALKTVLSTGSPLAPASYDFVYSAVKDDVCLASISGGTDLLACFALGNTALPVYHGQLQCLGLGMAVEIFDDAGRPLPAGGKGELVCTRPFPSMPVGFWNDPDGSRYHAAYFQRFPNIWAHGDYAERTRQGGLIMHGRSDAVLNPGGVRIGTSEIYREVERLPEVLDSVAIGQAWQDDTRVILFVVLRDSIALDQALEDAIRGAIRSGASPRHVPAKIIAVSDIPRTLSGKVVELAVRSVVHGEAVKNVDALANPAALDNFRNLPELSN
jgi:acetoacetyl-CoA synthetase